MVSLKFVIISVLVVTGVTIGMFEVSNALLNEYNVNVEGNLSATETAFRNAFNDTADMSNEIQTKIDESGGINVVDGIGILTRSALAGIKTPFDLIDILSGLFTDINNTLGIPDWVFPLAITVVVVLLLFAVYSAILRTPRV